MLPRYDTKPLKTIEAADFGTLVHHWKETGETDPAWASERDIVCLEEKILMSGIVREEWWPAGGRHEVSFAINLRTLELREYTGDRDGADAWKKTHGPEWLTGTIDYDGITGSVSQIPWIDDLKTGKWTVHPETRQLLSYSLYRWVKDGAPGDDWMLQRSITQWPKYPKAGLPKRAFGPAVFPLDMREHLDDLVWALDHPDEANPEPIDCGSYDPDKQLSICAFCPCRPQFPVSDWMNNYRYRAAPHCIPGMLRVIKEKNG